MSDRSYVFQLNVKVGNHLLNVTGDTAADFKEHLEWTTINAAGIVATAVAIEAAYGVAPLTAHVASTAVAQQVDQAYRAAAAQPSGNAPAPSCAHGPMRLRPAGVSKTGNQYNAFWACTADRANQCKSQNA